MHYHELKTIEQIVNTRGSKLWLKMNDNSKAAKQRHLFIQTHGGFFKQEGRYWKWVCPEDEQNGYWLKRVDTGEKTFFSNMSQFAESQGMTAVKICELLNGKRKTYKGWTAVELREVKETEGSHVKVKKKAPEKIAITKQVVFQDKITKQLYVVDNVTKFAKDNNLDANSLYKIARGKGKSYKNLVVYNPLDNIGNSVSDK
jgi:hypothetical protein